MRDVIVAANWKMHTTPADAGELARTDRRRGPASPASTRVICPPFVCLAAVRDALAEDGSGRRRSAPRTSITSCRARTPARSPRRCSSGSRLGHRRPLRAAARRRRDRRADRPQARAAPSRPACARSCASASSSTSARPGEPGRRRRPPARGRLARPRRRRRCARPAWSIAYEPVWAIGTGRNASGADAAAMAGAIRATLAELGWADARPRRAGPLRRQRHARRTSPSSWPSRRSTARSSAAPRSSPTRWPGSWPGPA